MLDWARITADIDHALTLDEVSRERFLAEAAQGPGADLLPRLLKRAHPQAGFLATSAPDAADDADALAAGAMVGVWRIEGQIGQGGMGEVYRAQRADGLYDQTVALKLMRGISESRAGLFEAERRRLAQLDHPGVARIIDGGVGEDGRPFMAMDYVDGAPVTDHARAAGLSRKARLVLFRKVCEAVGHAHSKLILHRDIKAENVLVDAGGRPRLIDFGIATVLDEEARGGPLTLATAAPEQLKGEPVSVQTDVFALGVLLHELLTGERPKRRPDGGMTVDGASLDDRDLAAILDRAMAADPAARYASTSALGDDVAAFLARRPVAARQGGFADAASKFVQRYPVGSALAAAVLVSLVAGLTASLNFAAQARSEAERANDALAQAEANLERSEFFLARANLFHATQSAYADTLQSMFGGDADVDRQTQVMLDRWRQAYDLRAEDPENAAFLSYAIGRQFIFRNDYPTAISVLEPWVAEAYGPPDLVGFARQLLALAYTSTGRRDDALAMLRGVERWHASGLDAGAPDHIASATQIAVLTEDSADIDRAEALLQVGLEVDHGPSVNMYFWNQLSRMRQLRGDFDGAYEASSNVVAIIDASPLMDVSGTDTGRLNLADFELWHTGDLARAEALVQGVLDTARDTKGESREQGLAHALQAFILVARGELDAAQAEVDAALTLVERYTGPASEATTTVRLQRAEILAARGDAGARDVLDAVRAEMVAGDPSARLSQRLALADVYVTARLDGVGAAQARYAGLAPDRAVIGRNPALTGLHRRLEGLGVL